MTRVRSFHNRKRREKAIDDKATKSIPADDLPIKPLYTRRLTKEFSFWRFLFDEKIKRVQESRKIEKATIEPKKEYLGWPNKDRKSKPIYTNRHKKETAFWKEFFGTKIKKGRLR